MRDSLSTGFPTSVQRSAGGRRTALKVLLVLITLITIFQLGVFVGIIRFHLAYVFPPFAALVATFICALINILFHRFFERHHLRLLYLATSLPFFLFGTAILTHFFEMPVYTILSIIIALSSLVWYGVLLRTVATEAAIE